MTKYADLPVKDEVLKQRDRAKQMLIAMADNLWLVDGIAKLLVMIEDISSQDHQRDHMFNLLQGYIADSVAEGVRPDDPFKLVYDIQAVSNNMLRHMEQRS